MAQNFWYPPGSSQAGIITVNQGTTPWVVADSAAETSLASIDTKTPTVGQKTMAASSPVVIASDQSAVPVSAASLPLPSGASTAALQTSGNASLSSIDGKIVNDTISATGSLTGANAVTLDVRGMNAVFANIGPGQGSLAGSVDFQGTVDGTTWYPISGSNLALLDGQVPSTTSTEGIFAFNVAGLLTFRLYGGAPSPAVNVYMRAQKDTSVLNQILAVTFVKDSTMIEKTASSDVTSAFDYRSFSYVGITQKIDTIVYKSGGSGGTTVATQTFGYDGSDRLTSITTT